MGRESKGKDAHPRFIKMCAPQVTRGSRRCAPKSTKKKLQIVPADRTDELHLPGFCQGRLALVLKCTHFCINVKVACVTNER
jgi:hypothetical protein